MNINKFSLGVEELALAYGLIGQPQMGKAVLIGAYDGLTEAQTDTLLTSASHSMLARGFCSISDGGSVHLDDEIEQSLYPIVRYKYIVTFAIESRGKETIQSQLFVDNDKFTSHFIRSGVVHVIEHGPIASLREYIVDTFSQLIPDSIKYEDEEFNLPIDISILGKAINTVRVNKSPKKVFLDGGWDEKSSEQITNDLVNQILRGSILRINTNSQSSDEDRLKVNKPTLLFLLGKNKLWTFNFATSKDGEIGVVQIFAKDLFIKKLENFVCD